MIIKKRSLLKVLHHLLLLGLIHPSLANAEISKVISDDNTYEFTANDLITQGIDRNIIASLQGDDFDENVIINVKIHDELKIVDFSSIDGVVISVPIAQISGGGARNENGW